MRRIILLAKEPSTYAGIAGFLGALGFYGLSTSDWAALIAVPMALAGALAVILPDPADPTLEKPRPRK